MSRSRPSAGSPPPGQAPSSRIRQYPAIDVAQSISRCMALVAGKAQHAEWPVLFITVPTTSGTGSEVSGGIVVTDSETHLKKGIAHPTVRAKHAIVGE